MKAFDRIRKSLGNIRWNERIRKMWLPIVMAIGLGVTICYNQYVGYGSYTSYEIETEYETEELLIAPDTANTIASDTTAADTVNIMASDSIATDTTYVVAVAGGEENIENGPNADADTPAAEQKGLNEEERHALIFFFGMGFLLIGLLQQGRLTLYREEQSKKEKWAAIGIHAVLLGALAADAWWMMQDEAWSLAVIIGHLAMYTALIIGLIVEPTIRQRNDHHLMRYAAETVLTSGLLCLIVCLAALALMGLVDGIETLFDIHLRMVKDYIFEFMMTGVLGCAIALMLPSAEKEGNASDFTSKMATIVGKYMLLPIVLMYMLVLYCYLIKIIVTWELPNGNVVTLTSVMMGGLLTIAFLLYPALYEANEETKAVHIARIGLPIMALPLLVLMSIGIGRRVMDYGWTVDRVYVVAANCWFYLACTMLLLPTCRKKLLTRLALSFVAGFALLSVIPYMNVASITQRVMTRQLETCISEASIAFPDSAITANEMLNWIDQLDSIESDPIQRKLLYLNDTYGRESVSRWVTAEGWLPADRYTKSTPQSGRGAILNYWSKSLPEYYTLPKDYRQIRIFNSEDEEVEEQEDGIFRLTFARDGDTIRSVLNMQEVDTAQGYLRLMTDDGDILILNHLYIYEYTQLNAAASVILQIKK